MADEKKAEVKPLAPAAYRVDIYEPEPEPGFEFIPRRHQKCIKLCGCSSAILLILVTTLLVLMFTVFHVEVPILNMNSLRIDGLDLLGTNNTGLINPGQNLTLVANVSVKNPNVASFKFHNTTTHVYYDGFIVGEVMGLVGRVGAQRTIRMDLLVDVMVDKILEVESFESDLVARILPISMFMNISGKVKIMDFIKRNVVVKMNCSMNVNVTSQAIQDRNCRRSRVSL